MPVIQFETTVEDNLIRIPEQYMNSFNSGTKVTVRSHDNPKRLRNCRAEAGALSLDDFPTILDTRDWKFDREEANERR